MTKVSISFCFAFDASWISSNSKNKQSNVRMSHANLYKPKMMQFFEETQQKEEKTQWKFWFNIYWHACKKVNKIELRTLKKWRS